MIARAHVRVGCDERGGFSEGEEDRDEEGDEDLPSRGIGHCSINEGGPPC